MPTQNNGKLASQTDNVSGEQVVYAYDALNRLASATATSGSWGQSYSYDGFGNLTAQNVTAGSAPAYSAIPDPTTNHVGSVDANGNTLGLVDPDQETQITSAEYDVENRFVGTGASFSYYSGYQYSYAPGNKRVWRGNFGTNGSGAPTITTDEVTFWSVTGQKMASYNIVVTLNAQGVPQSMIFNQTVANYYFGRKLVGHFAGGGYVGLSNDRLGSVGKYYPYGQDKVSGQQNGTEKFAWYFRDSETGFDYADQRYHNPGTGRFLTPDPYRALSTGASNPTVPGSWNQYAYAQGDPVNAIDSHGTEQCVDPDGNPCDEDPCDTDDFEDSPYDCGGGGGCGGPPPPPPPPPPCFDDLQMYTRPVNIYGKHGVGYWATHQYLQITTTTGQMLILDTVEGLNAGPTTPGGPNMLVGGVTVGANGPNDNSSSDKKFGGQLLIPCDLASEIVEDAADFNPVPYNFLAGFWGPNNPPGANSNTFMHWLLNVTGLSIFYPVPPPGAGGWWNSPGGGNFGGGS